MTVSTRMVYFFSVINIVQSNVPWKVHSEESIALRRILQSVARENVIIRIQESNMDDRMKRLLETISQTMIGAWPTQVVTSARLRSTWRSPNAASTRTMLIYLYPSFRVLDYGELNIVLQETRLISHPKHLPKLLLVCASNPGEQTPNTPYQLRYLWHQRFFNAVILEVNFPPRPTEPVFVAAHLYDGFAERYTKLTSYDDRVDWYPDKSRNMYGSRLQVSFEAAAPYGTLDPKSGGLGGFAAVFANALSTFVNATVVQVRGPGDLVYNAQLLMHTGKYSTNYEHTVSVGHDRVCLLLPVLSRSGTIMGLTEVIMSGLIGLLITTIVWSASMTLEVGERVRHPMNIISQILCITPANVARTSVEKIMFVTIMLATTEYAYVFHAELFRFNMKYTSHRRVSNFEDLYQTGLKVLAPPVVYEAIRTMEAVKKLPSAFLQRFQPLKLENGRGTLHPTEAYFVSESKGKLVELTSRDDEGKRLFKVYDLCVMYLYRVHRLPVRSPYREQVDRLLLMLTEHGFAKKHLVDFWERREERVTTSGIVIRDYSKYIAIVTVFIGCLLSLIVFVGELIVGLLSARKHSLRVGVVD